MQLSVYMLDELAGTLSNDGGSLAFEYDESYRARDDARALSVSLPLAEASFGNRASIAFFSNLLPEGEMRDVVARALGVSAANTFSMLAELGGDCAGAVVLRPVGATATHYDPPLSLSAAELADQLESIPRRPASIARGEPARMSLAGAQAKVPVIRDGEAVLLPRSWRDPTTHILKPEPSRYAGLVANEFFCMRLANRCGLATADVGAEQTINGLPYLSVARYDRDPLAKRRLHQEDLCQALGQPPTQKYQSEGGPSLASLFELLDRASAVPARDKLSLWRAVVFNFLIGNCDAHAKNFALLYESARPGLAPLYDLVSTAAYPDLTDRLACKIGVATKLDEVSDDAFVAAARDCELNEKVAIGQARELAAVVGARVSELASEVEHATDTVAEIVRGVEERAARLGQS